MDRERETGSEGTGDEEIIREGHLVVEERMNRREGLVEYEGTVGEGMSTTGERVVGEVGQSMTDATQETGGLGGVAMQAGATVLGGTGATAMVDDATTMAGTGTTGGTTGGSDDLSMSTDNTAAGGMTSDTVESGPITQVREGMTVVDAGGDDIGKVSFVKMGDPAAMTIVGEESGGGQGALDADGTFGGDGDPDLPEAFRNELIRVGYIQIDAKGWFGGDRYASADQIADVSGDTVRLSVAKDALPSG